MFLRYRYDYLSASIILAFASLSRFYFGDLSIIVVHGWCLRRGNLLPLHEGMARHYSFHQVLERFRKYTKVRHRRRDIAPSARDFLIVPLTCVFQKVALLTLRCKGYECVVLLGAHVLPYTKDLVHRLDLW
jgi:hypothetical protein